MENYVEEKETLNVKNTEKTEEKDTLLIVLLNKDFDFIGTRTPYDLEICGKKMWQWVAMAGDNCMVRTTVCTQESDILSLIKPYLDDKFKYTAVLYSDTPLIEKTTFIKIMQFVKAKQMNVLNLKRGYVFNTNYIKDAESISTVSVLDFKEDDFFQVRSMSDVSYVRKVIRDKINLYHENNGVVFIDKNTAYIDADVIVETGTTIFPNNTIKGQTYIGKNCVLEANNTIKDSVISSNCVIKNSYVVESRISDNIVVGPFESVINKSI